uniref:Uncharacterized protein n=1 Tax=Anopheles atroparvus TaxID=41427 RepID=A0AAG5DY64_ANOAO
MSRKGVNCQSRTIFASPNIYNIGTALSNFESSSYCFPLTPRGTFMWEVR